MRLDLLQNINRLSSNRDLFSFYKIAFCCFGKINWFTEIQFQLF